MGRMKEVFMELREKQFEKFMRDHPELPDDWKDSKEYWLYQEKKQKRARKIKSK